MCFNLVLVKNDDGSGTVGASFLYKSFIHMLQYECKNIIHI